MGHGFPMWQMGPISYSLLYRLHPVDKYQLCHHLWNCRKFLLWATLVGPFSAISLARTHSASSSLFQGDRGCQRLIGGVQLVVQHPWGRLDYIICCVLCAIHRMGSKALFASSLFQGQGLRCGLLHSHFRSADIFSSQTALCLVGNYPFGFWYVTF